MKYYKLLINNYYYFIIYKKNYIINHVLKKYWRNKKWQLITNMLKEKTKEK